MNQISKNLALWLVIFIMGFMLYTLVQKSKTSEIIPPSYSEFINMVENNQIRYEVSAPGISKKKKTGED